MTVSKKWYVKARHFLCEKCARWKQKEKFATQVVNEKELRILHPCVDCALSAYYANKRRLQK